MVHCKHQFWRLNLQIYRNLVALLLCTAFALPQAAKAASSTSPSDKATLTIVFTKSVSAVKARAGDVVHAKTTQILPPAKWSPQARRLPDMWWRRAGFMYDKTPYAKQKESRLTIQFDSLRLAGKDVALKVLVRAMADPLTSRARGSPSRPTWTRWVR